ncbi:MAG: cytochrome P450 [Myxococcales bacterium]
MSNATRAEFLAAKDATGEDVSLWRVLRGRGEDPLVRWTRIRERHGDVSRYRYGLDDSHLVTHPEGARRVLQDNAGNYTKEHPSYSMLRRLVGNGLLTSEGNFWLRQRRLAQPAFHRQRIAGMATQMTKAALDLAGEWEVRSSGPFSMLEEMSGLTLRIVADALFGTGLPARAGSVCSGLRPPPVAGGARSSAIREAWDVLSRQMADRVSRRRLLPPVLPTAYDRAFREARRTLFDLVGAIVAEKRARRSEEPDLLSMLMSARDEETGEQMTDAQLRDEVVTMVLAGHETTAVALSWAWALLDRHRGAREKLLAELASVLGGRAPTVADVPRLAYTRALIDEAMRLYPPAYIFFRRVKEDDVVCGYRIHRGGVIVMTPMIFHRHPSFWERPDAFEPERWAEEDRRPRFAFMPFSGGPRQCIGNNFAVLEAVLILATLAQRFTPRLAEGYLLEPEYGVTLRPSRGLPMRLS